jgi:YfiH family protein
MITLTASKLQSASIAHGFFGRTGGVSTGIFASLNCGPGSGDERGKVIENRRRTLEQLQPGATLLTLYQIHSPKPVVVTEPWEIGGAPQADAMVTDRSGLALGILTADCAPVLLADAEAKVIGAAHAGWKGALAGVIESAIAAMESLGASRQRIAAAIGPCISQANYEVGPEFESRFRDADPAHARHFAPSSAANHWRFDLSGYVAERLQAARVENIEAIPACTYAREEDFFSFRRATHRGETDYGRQLSAILLKT